MTDSRETLKLSNGLRIVLEHRDYSRLCSVNIRVACGSSFETEETRGTSHFIEHMLFKGTERRSAMDIANEMDETGSTANAYTGKEVSAFYMTVLSKHSARAADFLCDLVTSPLFLSGDVESEKGVIEEEIHMCEDTPGDVCFDAFSELVWQDGSLAYEVLGTAENVRSMTSEKLRRHFETYYTPERTVISVCGSFNKDEILEVIDKYYSGIKYGGNPPVFSPAVYHPGIRTVKKPYSQNQMIVGFEGLKINDGNRYTAHLLSTILCNSNSSMLFQRLREKLGIVYEVTAEHINYMESGAFAIFTAHSKEDEETVIREILDITDNFSRRVTDRELAIAKELVISNFVMGLEDIPDSCSVNGKQIMFTGNLRNIDEDIQKFSDVTAAQIKEFADGLFDRSRISLCVAGRTQSRKLYKDILGGV